MTISGGNLLASSFALQMKVADSKETFVSIYQSTRYHIPEYHNVDIVVRISKFIFMYVCIYIYIYTHLL
jgi:hypothetical protein